MTVWSMLEECISQLDEPFRRSEIIGWFRRHHPGVNESTLAAHIRAATANATNRAQNNPLGARRPLLRRVDHGLYVKTGQPREPAVDDDEDVQLSAGRPEPRRRCDADVILIGCVRTKKAVASPASELFASPLFEGRRRYAAGSGRPWYILSAKFGLLAPGDVIGPYDVYLATQSPGYQQAWGNSSPPSWSSMSMRCAGAGSRYTPGRPMWIRCGDRWLPAGRCWPCRWPICARASNWPGMAGIARATHRGPGLRPRRRGVLLRSAHLTWPGCCRIARGRCRLRSCALVGITTCWCRACIPGGWMIRELRTCPGGSGCRCRAG